MSNQQYKRIKELEIKREKLDSEIREIKRDIRRSQKHMPSSLEIEQIAEYERQLSEGLNPAPLVPRVDLERLVGEQNYERVLAFEEHNVLFETILRGRIVVFKAINRRSLWQSFGQEYIEPELLDFIDTIDPGTSRYFDVGASTGVFAIYAALKGLQTLCFEPEIANFALLNENAFLNREGVNGKLKSFNVALSENTEIEYMYIKEFEPAGHQKILGEAQSRGSREAFLPQYAQAVLSTSLDRFVDCFSIDPPTHMKIDVDGAELALLKGMTNILKGADLRAVFIEISDRDDTSQEALSLLQDHGFEIEKKIRVQNYFGDHNYILRRPN
ncbi:hypothetical protein MACH10_24930 [Thalassospira tepidiphila]|uniref:FkbM family methyltransferase n=1 Tax=Thalassospira tepidiphila TaxID=393657 RepID=UPI002922460F|nr:hypothetical protein MACH10_24930 [Thalassospira tepidiphila]